MPASYFSFKSCLLAVAYFFCTPFTHAQTASEILSAVKKAQQNITTVSYAIQRIDTFRSGEIWNNTGTGYLKKDRQDTLFGYAFKAKRNDVNSETIYDRYRTITIDHPNKTFHQFSNPGRGILGFPGAQMVFEELMHIDTSYVTRVRLLEDGNEYILRMDYELPTDAQYDVKERYKLFYIDKKLWLPVKMYEHLLSLGQKQARHMIINDVAINATGDTFMPVENISPDYKPLVSKNLQDEWQKLVGMNMPAFQLNSFDGTKSSSADFNGKVVLLDFWELWCGPCIASMPKVEQLYKHYKKDGLEVIGIMNETNNITAAKLLAQKKKLSFLMLLGNDALRKAFNVQAVPLYVIVGKTGKIRFVSAGYSDELVPQLEAALRE